MQIFAHQGYIKEWLVKTRDEMNFFICTFASNTCMYLNKHNYKY